jgi:hypothetical protein
MKDLFEDSTGKNKVPHVRARSAILSGALIIGVCLGVIAGEKLYILTQNENQAEVSALALRSRKALEGGAISSIGALRSAGKPRSDLEAILQRVAPNGEVMIAISNFVLIEDKELLLWLEVAVWCPCCWYLYCPFSATVVPAACSVFSASRA